jgi:hypothetical protein
LRKFKFQRERYVKSPSGDVHNLVEYQNLTDGIILTAYVQENEMEYVDSVRIEPAKKRANALKCEESK